MARDARVGPERSSLLSKAKGRIYLSQASLVEIAQELHAVRLRFPLPPQIWLEKALEISQCIMLPLTPGIVARSARIPGDDLDSIDRLIAASAIEHDLELATWNPALRDLAGIRYFF